MHRRVMQYVIFAVALLPTISAFNALAERGRTSAQAQATAMSKLHINVETLAAALEREIARVSGEQQAPIFIIEARNRLQEEADLMVDDDALASMLLRNYALHAPPTMFRVVPLHPMDSTPHGRTSKARISYAPIHQSERTPTPPTVVYLQNPPSSHGNSEVFVDDAASELATNLRYVQDTFGTDALNGMFNALFGLDTEIFGKNVLRGTEAAAAAPRMPSANDARNVRDSFEGEVVHGMLNAMSEMGSDLFGSDTNRSIVDASAAKRTPAASADHTTTETNSRDGKVVRRTKECKNGHCKVTTTTETTVTEDEDMPLLWPVDERDRSELHKQSALFVVPQDTPATLEDIAELSASASDDVSKIYSAIIKDFAQPNSSDFDVMPKPHSTLSVPESVTDSLADTLADFATELAKLPEIASNLAKTPVDIAAETATLGFSDLDGTPESKMKVHIVLRPSDDGKWTAQTDGISDDSGAWVDEQEDNADSKLWMSDKGALQKELEELDKFMFGGGR